VIVRFDNIGRIVDHHHLNFLFIRVPFMKGMQLLMNKCLLLFWLVKITWPLNLGKWQTFEILKNMMKHIYVWGTYHKYVCANVLQNFIDLHWKL